MELLISPIADCEGYAIANNGDVFCLRHGRLKKLVARVNGTGNLCVNLKSNGVYTSYTVHKLVAEHFMHGWELQVGVSHRDGDVSNNSVNNLELYEY